MDIKNIYRLYPDRKFGKLIVKNEQNFVGFPDERENRNYIIFNYGLKWKRYKMDMLIHLTTKCKREYYILDNIIEK